MSHQITRVDINEELTTAICNARSCPPLSIYEVYLYGRDILEKLKADPMRNSNILYFEENSLASLVSIPHLISLNNSL